VEYVRYMDDFWVFTTSFARAREIQDTVERRLYEDRLSLGGEKSRIRRTATALAATETAAERLAARRQEIAEEIRGELEGGYGGDDDVELPEEEIDEAAVHLEYDELSGALGADQYPTDVRPRLIAVYRSLEKGRDTYALPGVPDVLTRMPDLTWPAVRYVAATRTGEVAAAENVMLDLLDASRFHRDQEWMHLCRAGLLLHAPESRQLAARYADLAISHSHALVRARALLAWGRLSANDDFDVADQYWLSAQAAWRPYVLISLQHKDRAGRDRRYDSWSGDGRTLRMLAETIQASHFPWREL
jgi:hypothetical protein